MKLDEALRIAPATALPDDWQPSLVDLEHEPWDAATARALIFALYRRAPAAWRRR